MHLCVFEDEHVGHFLPLVHTRAVYDLRLGMRTLLRAVRESFGDAPTMLHARRQVAAVTGAENDLLVNRIPEGLDVLFVNGRWVVEEGPVLERIRRSAGDGGARTYVCGDELVAAWVPGATTRFVEDDVVTAETFDGISMESVDGVRFIRRLWDLQTELHPALHRDYAVRTKGLYVYERPGVTVGDGALLSAGERIYLGPGTVVRPGAVLNAEDGPIYVGSDVEIKERAVIKGPAFVGSRSIVNSDADVEGSALGYWCRVGGQVHDSVIHSLSNKAHAGYLGNAYVGRWCNLGAATDTSNLRNDYGDVSMYDAVSSRFEGTGLQFLGPVLGDHTKTGIHTMLNTGTVAGVFCNLFGAGFMPRFIPSFSWGGPGGFDTYRLEKAFRVAEAVMQRRGRSLTDAERENLTVVYKATRAERVAG